jgi:polyhydroxyalkanoate synthase subunit PhaE
MSTPFSPDSAFTAAAERFYELLRTFTPPGAAGARRPDWSSIAAPLAGQFEQWLRMSQFAGPWVAAAATPQGATGGTQVPWLFGALPLGPAAAQPGEAQRAFELLGQLAQLQTRLAVHWGEIASTAARRFVSRLGKESAPASLDDALRLYALWVECAEEAYGATARSQDFAQLQAELANTSAALLVEQRRQAENLTRAFGLPTRSEVDALYGQLKELRQQLSEAVGGLHEAPPAARSAPAAAESRAARRSARKPPAKGRRGRRPRA